MSGKVVVVTGAAQGIGAATAKKLCRMGMRVALLDRSKEDLENTTQSLRNEGGTVHSVVCDVTNKEKVFSAVEDVRKQLGSIDVLIANAGVANPSSLEYLSVDKWLQVVDVNVVGVLHCVAAVLPGMMEKKEGHIVFTASIAGRAAIPCMSTYSGSKHFIQGFAAGIRQELAPQGIKVTCIQPGMVYTNLTAPKNLDQESLDVYEKLGVPFGAGIEPLSLQPEDVAESIGFCLTQKDRVGVNQITVERATASMQCN